MAFWDPDDGRYKDARAQLILSLKAVGVVLVVLTVLLWPSHDESRETASPKPPAPAIQPPPDPAEIRHTQIADFRSRLDRAARARDWDQMADLSRELLALAPEDGDAWAMLGWAQDNLGDPSGALTSYGKAIKFSPDKPAFNLYMRARFFRKQREFAAAIRDLEDAARQDPGSVGMANLLMIFKIQGGRAGDVRLQVRAYEDAALQAQANTWLLGAAALALHDKDIRRASSRLADFQSTTTPAIFAELLTDPFFDPWRNEAELLPFFLRSMQ